MREASDETIREFEDKLISGRVEARSIFRRMRSKMLFGCLVCGREWEAEPRDMIRAAGTGCKKCGHASQRKPNEVISKVGNILVLRVESLRWPTGTMLIYEKKWEILQREGIGRVSLCKKGYPKAFWKGKREFVHRILMRFPKAPEQVDHINGVKTDNRMSNLRIVTALENQMNRGIRKTNTSGITGVHEKKPGVWESCLKVNRKTVHRSVHKTREDAAAARRRAVEEHCGEYAPRVG